MNLAMANVDVKDNYVGTRDTELDGLMIRKTNSPSEDVSFYLSSLNRAQWGIGIALLFSYDPPPFLWKVSYII